MSGEFEKYGTTEYFEEGRTRTGYPKNKTYRAAFQPKYTVKLFY